MKHSVFPSSSLSSGLNPVTCVQDDQVALDGGETRFLELCRRHDTGVSYPRHVPTPPVVTNLQQRGLTYQSASGQGLGTVPVWGATIPLPLTTCPITQHSDRGQNGEYSERQDQSYQLLGGQLMTQMSTAARRQRQSLRRELSAVHRQNLQRRLQHRLDVARSNGNNELLHQLEQEMSLLN